MLFTGDILFSGAHPIAWAGPVSNWIAACERIVALDPDVIVPGHGPLSDTDAVRELPGVLRIPLRRGAGAPRAGHDVMQAARSIGVDRWADWGEGERLVVNVANIYAELEGSREPLNPLQAFQQMAELAASPPP